MPEPTQLTQPVANPQGATPNEAGSADLAGELMAELSAPAPSPAPPAPTPTPTPPTPTPAPPTPTPAPPATPPAPAKTPDKPQFTPPAVPTKPAPTAKKVDLDDPKLPPSELRKHVKTLEADLAKTREEKDKTVIELNNKLKHLEQKRFWTEEDEKTNAAVTQRLSALESDLYGRDYTKSPEYQKLYTDKIDSQAVEALDVFKSLNVVSEDADLNEVKREGNWSDVTRLYNAPNNAERRRIAKDLFKEDFQEALDVINPMVETKKAAEQAVKDKSENYKSEVKSREEKQAAMRTQIQQLVKQHSDQLAANHPEIFAAGDDPDAEKALKQGFDFVDESSSKQDMDMNERAQRVALIRSWAGAYPRLVGDLNKLRAKIATLEEENSKYRASDPSNAGELGKGSPAPSGDGGSDDLAAEIDRLNQA